MFQTRYALCVLVGLAVLPATGTTIDTGSYSTWRTSAYISDSATQVALSSLTYGTTYDTSAGVTYDSYGFTGPDGANWWLKSSSSGSYYGLLGDKNGGIEVASPGNAFFIWAVATDGSNSDSLDLTLSDGSSYVFSGGIGFSSSSSFSSFIITPTKTTDSVLLYEVDFANSSLPQDSGGGTGNGTGDPSDTPEAATLALVGGGMLIVFGAKRKFTNKFAF